MDGRTTWRQEDTSIIFLVNMCCIRGMGSISILHRRTPIFFTEQLEEKAGILISDSKADIIC